MHIRRLRGWIFAILCAAAACAILLISAATAQNHARDTPTGGCPRILLYFTRGSGQKIGQVRGLGSPGGELYEILQGRYRGELGVMANPYRAVNVAAVVNLFGTRYGASVANGVQSEVRNIMDLGQICAESYLILGGYSQGAQVTRLALHELVRLDPGEVPHIAAVVLFGDPYFNFKEPNVLYPQAATDPQRFNPRRHGILLQRPFARAVAIDPVMHDRVFSWCHRKDVVCQGGHVLNPPGIKGHTDYERDKAALNTAVAAVARRLRLIGLPPLVFEYRVVGTCTDGECGLAKWSGPGVTTGFSTVGAVSENETVAIVCQTTGETVTGQNGVSSAIWDKLTDGAFVPDYYIDTPNVGVYSAPIPRCANAGA